MSRSRRTPSRRSPEPVTASTRRRESFCLEYLANGFNAKQAYRTVHPRATARTAEVEGSKYLRKPEVAAFLAAERTARTTRLRMDGDEALVRITTIARGDIRRLFDAQGRLLPVEQMPDDIADCVKALRPGRHGTTVVLFDKLKACELMAVAAGRLRTNVDHQHAFQHEDFLGAEPPAGDDE